MRIKIITFAIIITSLLAFGAKSCVNKSKSTKSGSSAGSAFTINAPSNLTATVVSESQINLYWIDNSNNDDGFQIERSINGTSYELTNTTNLNFYADSELIPYNNYYYRVRAFNSIGDTSAWSNEANAFPRLIFSSITCGEAHNLAITTNGLLWTWGANDFGQLGIGDSNIRLTPLWVREDNSYNIFQSIERIAAGEYHSIALKTDSTIWGWGANASGQLATGDTESSDWPFNSAFLGTDSDWNKISAGAGHNLGVKTNGTLYVWGWNVVGQLGLGDMGEATNRLTPVQIGSDSDWSVAIGGGGHTIAIKTNLDGSVGTLWAWGDNSYGQLGDSTTTYRLTPKQVVTDSDWAKIGVGYFHSMGIKTNKVLYSWGENVYGELGLGDSGLSTERLTPTQVGIDSDWDNIDGGVDHTIGIKTNGSIYSWGYNDFGQLGLGDSGVGKERNTPTQIGIDTDWIEISAGTEYGLARKTNGSICSWGNNAYGQLGLGDTIDRNIPYLIGGPFPPASLSAIAVSSTQVNLSWLDSADNEQGFKIERKAGTGGTFGQIATVNFDILSYSNTEASIGISYYYRIRAFSANGNSSYSNTVSITPTLFAPSLLTAVFADIQVNLSWTDNSIDEDGFSIERKSLGGSYQEITTVSSNIRSYYDTTISDNFYYYKVRAFKSSDYSDYSNDAGILVGGSTGYAKVAGGSEHAIAIKTSGLLWGWGSNVNGQLGIGNTQNMYFPYPTGTALDWKDIYACENFSIACKTDNTLFSWGKNNYGQLGLGYTTPMGTGITTPTQIGTDSDWDKTAVGNSHAIAVKTSGTIWAWGASGYGQLGLGSSSGNRNTPAQIGTDSDWSSIGCGVTHSFGIKKDGTIYSWGNNENGRLGLGYASTYGPNIPTQIGSDSDWNKVYGGTAFTLALKTNKTIWSWGKNYDGQLGHGGSTDRSTPKQIGTDSEWTGISAGDKHGLGCKTNGTIYSWGSSNYGQLGFGNTATKRTPTQIGTDSNWVQISAGFEHSLGLKTNSSIYSWGKNNYGQLGLSDTINRLTPALVGE
jgi:alpha-tubulin suppressor-like RCC1 family protein